MPVEYPDFNDRERKAAFSATKKLTAVPQYRESAGEFVFAANIGRPPLLTDSLFQPAEFPIKQPEKGITSEPKLSPPELRVISKALPALVADGRLNETDGKMYSSLVQRQLGANRWEFTRTNRRFLLGNAAGLGIGAAVTSYGIGLLVSGIRGNQQIDQEVGNHINSLYQSDPRNLHGRPAASSQQLKADKDMRDERKILTQDQLQRRGLVNEQTKIVGGGTIAALAGIISAAVTVAFIQDLKDRIRWWKRYLV